MLPVVKPRHCVTLQTAGAVPCDALGIAAAAGFMQQLREPLADLRRRERRRVFFFPRRASRTKNHVAISDKV